MALEINEQIVKALERSKTPLLALRENPTVDGLGSALAIARMLRAMGKAPEIVSANYRHPGFSFLPEDEPISGTLTKIKPLVISLDVTKTKIEELTYDLADGKLNIYLTPKEGSWNKENVSLSSKGYRYDLIITFECPDLASLGHVFKNEPELFTSMPVINIDHDPSNEHYGHLNAVDITSTSCAEIIYPLLKDAGAIDNHTSTLLLSGIISKTRSFKTENVSPRSLRYASELVASGAARELVVHELYKTKDVATLRLWGRALSRLKFETGSKLVWTLLSKDDFMHAGAGEEALPEVVHELLSLSKDIQVAAIIYEQRAGGICVKLTALNKINALSLAEPWEHTGSSREASFCLMGNDIVSAERQVIEHLKKTLNALPR